MKLKMLIYTVGSPATMQWPKLWLDDNKSSALTTECEPEEVHPDPFWLHIDKKAFPYAVSAQALEDLYEWINRGIEYYNEKGTLPPIPLLNPHSDHST